MLQAMHCFSLLFPTCAICIKSCCTLASLPGSAVACGGQASSRACSSHSTCLQLQHIPPFVFPSPPAYCHAPEDAKRIPYNMTLAKKWKCLCIWTAGCGLAAESAPLLRRRRLRFSGSLGERRFADDIDVGGGKKAS